MAEVASAFVSIMPSAKGFGSKLDSQIGGQVDSSGKKMGARLGNAMKGGALAVLGGAVLAGAFLKDAVGAAGDLEQSIGAIDTVFGKSSGQMKKWSKGAAQSVGLTQNEFNELGTLIGSQLKNGGTAMDKLAPKANNLITMGADLSSMFGGSTKEAVEALSSALKGERDPIERYGVSLNQAKIDAEAASLGFEKVGGSLTDQAKQAATLSLITKQTADAQGNFAKESDTLAGKQQRLSAQFGNFKTTIGTALLPVMTKVFGFLNDTALPAITSFTDTLGKGSPIIQRVGDFIKSNLLPPIQDLAGWVMNSLVPAIQDFARSALPGVQSALGSVKKGLSNAQPFFEFLGDVVTNVLLPVLGKLARIVLPILGDAIEAIGEAFGALGKIGTALWNKALQPAFKFIIGGVASILDMWSSMLGTLAKVPGFGWAKKAADAMAGAATKAREMADGIKKIPSNKTVTITTSYITRNAGKERQLDFNPRALLGNGPKQAFQEVIKQYGAAGRNLMAAITKGIKTASPKTVEAARKAFDSLTDKLTEKRDGLRSALEGFQSDFAALADSVSSAFTGDLFNASEEGKTASQSFIDNLMGKKSQLTSLLAAFTTLQGWGLSPSFLSQLFASGNGALITELAGMGQAGATSTATLFGEVTALGDQLGQSVAQNDPVATRIDETNRLLGKVDRALSFLADDIGDRLNGAAAKAGRSGKKDKK